MDEKKPNRVIYGFRFKFWQIAILEGECPSCGRTLRGNTTAYLDSVGHWGTRDCIVTCGCSTVVNLSNLVEIDWGIMYGDKPVKM